jgi:hypothetical protein
LKYGLKYAGVLQRKRKRSKQQAAVQKTSYTSGSILDGIPTQLGSGQNYTQEREEIIFYFRCQEK